MNAENAAPKPPAKWLGVVVFLIIYGVLQAGYLALRQSDAQFVLVDQITVAPAAGLLSLLFPSDEIFAVGDSIEWTRGTLNLLNGCDGFDLMVLLIAAILSSPTSVRHGAAAIVLGLLGLWALNQLRIVLLFWSIQSRREWFDALHTVWCPALLICFAVGFYWTFVLKAPSSIQT